MFRANVVYGLVDHLLKLVRRDFSERFASLLDGLVEDAPADGFLNKLRDIAFFHAMSTQVGAQGYISLLGPSDSEPGGFIWYRIFSHKHLSCYQYGRL